MSRTLGLAAIAAGMTLGAPAAADADVIDQVKVGVLIHNVCVTTCKNADKESGPIVDIQMNFRSPEFLRWAGGPHPYVSISPNVSGDTSFAAVGLEWRWEFVDGWAFVPGLGYALHNGETNNAYRNGDPRATPFAAGHVLYGSRNLFRNSVGLQHEFTDKWSAETYYVHYSHGQILGHGRNQGADQVGVRVNYKFKD